MSAVTSSVALLVALLVVAVIGVGFLALCVALAQAAARTARAEHDACELYSAPVTIDGGLESFAVESLGEEDGEGDYIFDIERHTHTPRRKL